MSKKCVSCGAELTDEAKFCNKCGTAQDSVTANNSGNQTNGASNGNLNVNEILAKGKDTVKSCFNKFKSNKKIQGIVAAVVVALVVLLVLVNVVFPGPKKVLKTYCKGMKNFDAKKVVKTLHPDYIESLEEYTDGDFVDSLDEEFDDYKDEDLEYLSYEINDDYDKYDKDDLEELAEDLSDTYDIKEKDVKKAREYRVKFKIDDDGDKDTKKSDVLVVKVKSKWYVFPGYIG